MLHAHRSFAVLLLPLVLFAGGCGEEDTGESPSIANLRMQAGGLVAGMQVTLSGSVDFIDPDGDLDQLELTLVPPSGAAITTAADIVGADGKTEGQTAIALVVLPPVAGEYTLTAIAIDAEGQESNELQTMFTVAEP